MKPRFVARAIVFLTLLSGCQQPEKTETRLPDNLGLNGVVYFGVWENLQENDFTFYRYKIDLESRTVGLIETKHAHSVYELNSPAIAKSGLASPDARFKANWDVSDSHGNKSVQLSTPTVQFSGAIPIAAGFEIQDVTWAPDSSGIAVLSEKSQGCKTAWRFITHDDQCHDFDLAIYSLTRHISIQFPLKKNVPGVGIAYLQWPSLASER